MDTQIGEKIKPLGPEWLLSRDTVQSFIQQHEELRSNVGDIHTASRIQLGPADRRANYLAMGRSHSSPIILENIVPNEHNIHNDKLDSIVIPEQNSFDRDFPSLLPPTNKTQKINGILKETVWKQEVILSKVATQNATLASQTVPEKSSSEDELHLEHLRGLVPSLAPSKMLKKVELLTPGKKSSSKLDNQTKTKKSPNPIPFRKATSEPTLPLNPSYAESYAKSIRAPLKKVEKPIIEDKSKVIPRNRNDFFQGLIRMEEQQKKKQEDGEMIVGEENKQKPEVISDDQPQYGAGSEHCGILNSAKKFSPEDEERFLRNLGWVPEEESHVPELTEEEILEVKNYLLTHRNFIMKEKTNLKIKKWQQDRVLSMSSSELA